MCAESAQNLIDFSVSCDTHQLIHNIRECVQRLFSCFVSVGCVRHAGWVPVPSGTRDSDRLLWKSHVDNAQHNTTQHTTQRLVGFIVVVVVVLCCCCAGCFSTLSYTRINCGAQDMTQQNCHRRRIRRRWRTKSWTVEHECKKWEIFELKTQNKTKPKSYHIYICFLYFMSFWVPVVSKKLTQRDHLAKSQSGWRVCISCKWSPHFSRCFPLHF